MTSHFIDHCNICSGTQTLHRFTASGRQIPYQVYNISIRIKQDNTEPIYSVTASRFQFLHNCNRHILNSTQILAYMKRELVFLLVTWVWQGFSTSDRQQNVVGSPLMGHRVWKWEHQRIFHFASKMRILVLFAVCNAYKHYLKIIL